MTESFTTVDAGNTTCKVARIDGRCEQIERQATLDSGPDLPELLARELEDCQGPIVICSVLGATRTQALATALGQTAGRRIEVHPPAGLELKVEQPETVGLDRLYVARGAFELYGAPAIVLDAGTALTVDLLGPGPSFEGGAIAAGPGMLADALASHGAQLHQVQPLVGAPALGRETAAALRAGIGVGFEGAGRLIVRRLVEEAQLEQPTVVLTGGARSFLEPGLLEDWPDLRVEPDLVLIGLAAAFTELQASSQEARR